MDSIMDNVTNGKSKTKPIIDQLKSAKAILGLSDEEIAERANIHRHTVRKVLSGNPRVEFGSVLAIAGVLGVKVNGRFEEEAA